MDNRRVKILVAEAHALVAEAVGDILLELDREAVVVTATTMRDALDLAQREQPDLVVIDAWMWRDDAGVAVRRVRECSPRSAIAVLCSHLDQEFELLMLQAGAALCIEKEDFPAKARAILDSAGRRP